MTTLPPILCPHWSDCGVSGGGCCAAGKYGGRPSRGVCLVCLGQPPVPLLKTERIPPTPGATKPAKCGGCGKKVQKIDPAKLVKLQEMKKAAVAGMVGGDHPGP